MFKGGLPGKREATFSPGGCSFYIKNELKSEIFNEKKSLQTKMFLRVHYINRFLGEIHE